MDRPQPIGRNSVTAYSSGMDFTESSVPEVSEESGRGFMRVSWITSDKSNVRSLDSANSSTNSSIVPEVFTFQNTNALCDDLRCIINLPEMCDVIFRVGKDQVPIYGLKAILATRSRTFFQTLLSQHECAEETVTTPNRKFRLKSKILGLMRKASSRTPRSVQRPSELLTLTVPEFDPTTFRQLIQFLHCGDIELSLDNVIGILNAADSYGVDDLRAACVQLVKRLLDFNTVFPLLAATESYAQFPLTLQIISEIMKFVDEKAQTLLRMKNFGVLSKDAAISVLSRRSLHATETAKWDAALLWSRRHCQRFDGSVLRCTLRSFSPFINFSHIPLKKLSHEILPLGFLQEDIIRQAFASQNSSRCSTHRPEVPRRKSMRKQTGSSRLHRVFSTRRRSSGDSGFVASLEDS